MAKRGKSAATPGSRFHLKTDLSEITRADPEKKLVKGKAGTGGRNSAGRVTARHRGGGHKRRYRQIDFKRNKDGIPARVAHIEYDPNRSARIALLHYEDGEKRYIVAARGQKVGDTVISGESVEVQVGNCMSLRAVPPGMPIHNIEMEPGRGGQICRTAGGSASLLAKHGNYAHISMPSGEIRKIHINCRATIGEVGNPEWNASQMGKAGRNRWRGRRPHVRGTAMNPVAHPMGGGEGRKGGGRHPCSPTGKLSKGFRTRKKHQPSDSMIVRRRKRRGKEG